MAHLRAQSRCVRARSARLPPQLRRASRAARCGGAGGSCRAAGVLQVSCSSSLSLLSQTTDGLVQAVPVLIHAMQFGAAARREPVVLARGTFLRLLDVRLDEP